jgi:signal transduction histidine kinase
MKHQDLVKAAMNAIRLVANDRSVSNRKTKDSLEELLEEINIRIEALNCDDSEDE